MTQVFDLTMNVEIQGNVRRFNSAVNNEEIKFSFEKSDKIEYLVTSYWDGEYEITDNNIEQGRRFIVEVNLKIYALSDDTKDLRKNIKPICIIKNKRFSVVDCKITEFAYLKAL